MTIPRICRTLVIVLLATGCGFGSVKLTIGRDQYRPGEDVALRLRNRSLRSAGYNLCGSKLERLEPEGWRPVPDDDGTVCLSILYVLGPLRTSDPWIRALPTDLPDGRYRFSTEIEHPMGSEWRQVSSPELVVSGGEAQGEPRRSIALPRELVLTPVPEGLAVSANSNDRQEVPIEPAPGLVVGVSHSLFAVRGGERTLLSSGLGGEGDVGRTVVPCATLVAADDGGQVTLELELQVFETDVPVEHLWAPASGSRYRVLWEGVVRQDTVVEGCVEAKPAASP